MMDEVGLAALRMKRVLNGESVEAVYGDDNIGGYTAGECWECDHSELIEYVISERNARNDSPVTHASLGWIGAEIQELAKHQQRWMTLRGLIVDDKNKRSLQVDVAIDGFVSVHLVDRFGSVSTCLIDGPDVKIVDVRRLAIALGIQLKEEP